MNYKTKVALIISLTIIAAGLLHHSLALLHHNNAVLAGAGMAVSTGTDWLVLGTAFLSGALITGAFALIFKGEE